ncbi:hypothetical protein MVES_003420 [Malassezia vespertilionis]|uniref:Uncharacterized protein n=2 Tax=Malassezia vespertilionis TaxID=2020962 RepID=A0A2N1J7R3_9BASI|nr:hypothetical protein MVES_003420 [Malassezia vespertilionis]
MNQYGPPIELPSYLSWEKLASHADGAYEKVLAWSGTAAKPPPPPPPPSLAQTITHFLHTHKRTLACTLGGVALVGLGVALRYKWPSTRPQARGRVNRHGVRMQAVLVLGADTPLGHALALHLASLDLIVLASVASEAAQRTLAASVSDEARGYVKSILFDPREPGASEDAFVHGVHAALSLRYPLSTAGDPYARPGESVQVLGLVNAQSYAPDAAAFPAAFEQWTPADLETALRVHVVYPLSVMNRLCALLAALPNRVASQEEAVPVLMLTLLSMPALDVALPMHGATSILAQAVHAGVDTLRRETDVQLIARRTNQPLLRRWTSPRPELRRIQWTVMELSASQLRTFAQGTAPVFQKTAALLFSRGMPVWPRYTIVASSRLAAWCERFCSACLHLLPSAVLDLFISVHMQVLARRASTRSLAVRQCVHSLATKSHPASLPRAAKR